MSDTEQKAHKGHALAKFGIAPAAAKYYSAMFRTVGRATDLRQGLCETFGLAEKKDLEVISEELDRLSGMVRRLKRESGA